MPKAQLCWTDAYNVVRLYQVDVDRYTVQYGKQIDRNLFYGQAAAKLGQALMHAAACEGRLDNRTAQEMIEAGDRKPYYDEAFPVDAP